MYIIKLYYFNLEFLKKNCIRPSFGLYTYSNQKYFMNGLQLSTIKQLSQVLSIHHKSQVQSVLFMYM